MPALCNIQDQSNLIVGLQGIQLTLETTAEDLQNLVSTAVANEDDELKYAFYINDVQITKTLGEAIYEQGLTLEQAIQIKAVPQEKVNVSALSRCSGDLPGHEDAVLCLQFAPDSRFLASGSGDKTIRIWDCQTGTCCSILRGHQTWVLSMRYSPDGQRLATADYDGVVCIWNTQNYSLLKSTKAASGKKAWITCIQWDYSSQAFYTGAKDGCTRMYNKEGDMIKVLGSQSKCVTSLTATCQYVISASEDCSVCIYDIQQKQCVKRFTHAHWVNSVCSSTHILIRFGIHGVARLFQYYKTKLAELKINTSEQLFALSKEQQIQIVYQVAMSQKQLLVTASDDHTLHLYDLSSLTLIQQMTGHVRQINHAVFSPSGQFIASCAFDRTVRLWSAEGKFISKFQCHASEVYQLVFSADSRMILSAGKDSTCKIYSVKQQKLIRELNGHSDAVYCVDWSLSGEYGASGSKDKLVKLWRQ